MVFNIEFWSAKIADYARSQQDPMKYLVLSRRCRSVRPLIVFASRAANHSHRGHLKWKLGRSQETSVRRNSIWFPLARFLRRMLTFPRFICRRHASTVVNLFGRLKQLNDANEFRNALDLFNQHVRYQSPTDLAIFQAPKACIELGDVQSASLIHRNQWATRSL